MFKKGSFFLTILIFSLEISYSQNNKTVIASIQYKTTLIDNKIVLIDDICQLDIAKNKSYFYSVGELENLHRINARIEKAPKTGNSIDLGTVYSKDRLHKLCNFKVLKDYNAKKAFYIENIGSQNLGFIKDSLTTKRWIITNETTKIVGLLCHKATMEKNKISITAWFCIDVPFQDGPFSYYGLPGLIIKLSTSTGFEANLISISYNKDAKKILDIAPFALVTELQLNKAAENQNAAFRSGKLPNGDEAKQISGDH